MTRDIDRCPKNRYICRYKPDKPQPKQEIKPLVVCRAPLSQPLRASNFVFLFIVCVLAAQFVTRVPVGDAAENLSEGSTTLAQYDADRYILLMFHAMLTQRFCSGLVAGTMGSGSAYSGLKRSLIMVAISVPDICPNSGRRE